MYYSPYYNWFMPAYRQYKPVTAYTLSVPIYVNGTDINKPPYSAINYQPEGVQYPYVYVPIAQFSKVGAVVNWDDKTQTLNVTTDYFTLKQSQQSQQTSTTPEVKLNLCHDALAAMRLAYKEISSKVSVTDGNTAGKVRYNGTIADNKVVFDGQWWSGYATNLTVGKYYSADYDDPGMMQRVLIITNDIGEKVSFQRDKMGLSIEGLVT